MLIIPNTKRTLQRYFSLFVALITSSFFANGARAQTTLPSLDEVDMLMTNLTVQLEITSGIDAMYNFDFKVAEGQFNWLKSHYPEHPLPYFLLGLSQWWKIVPNIENTSYDKDFFVYMDSAIYFADKIYKKDKENQEALFILAGTWAFEGRLNGERHNWAKATFAVRKALNYFDKLKGMPKTPLTPELLYGDGLYNYYVEWIKENYRMLRTVLWMFDGGDKALGIEQLETCGKEAFYTRIEAMYYLMKVHSSSGGKMIRALQISEYLYKKYPNNPYFQRYYARLLYYSGRYPQLYTVSKLLLERVDEGMFGYEEMSGRYAAFYLGAYYRDYLSNPEKANYYYQRAVKFVEDIGDYGSGYYHYSLAALARYAKQKQDWDNAELYYSKILTYAAGRKKLQDEAKKFKKENKKRKKAAKKKK
ncbi:tol-pal system protein YbgF [Flammeovirga sp. EKP202]|uniref:tol-pal system protein YbgF n=1 Tax=Flammeovirga sp. EKP202 TaxID=2770592 RepID=UPI00165F7E5A|nr:tol-pal system protein YbgF [Flammeovirga sp. EKP202]MBD0400325.1 tol-pal system protein YbgF [Flammeovirga sp. EKP202]